MAHNYYYVLKVKSGPAFIIRINCYNFSEGTRNPIQCELLPSTIWGYGVNTASQNTDIVHTARTHVSHSYANI